MRMLLGDFNYPELQGANPIMAPILFYLYICYIFFILLNMFLAIINGERRARHWADRPSPSPQRLPSRALPPQALVAHHRSHHRHHPIRRLITASSSPIPPLSSLRHTDVPHADSYAEVKANQTEEDLLYYVRLKNTLVERLNILLGRKRAINKLAKDLMR